MITRGYLERHIAEMKNTIVAYNGAIEFAEHLLTVIDNAQDVMTPGEFAKTIGGDGATVKIEPVMEFDNEN